MRSTIFGGESRAMLMRYLVNKQLDRLERQLGVTAALDYMRFMYCTARHVFFKFVRVAKLAGVRKALPLEPYFVATLLATQSEDCGACVQMGINMARHAGVAPELLQAVLAGEPEELNEELADVYHFTLAVLQRTGAEEALREKMRARYGDAGLVELATAIAASRIFPVTKRALGYATSCSVMQFQFSTGKTS